MKNLLPSLLIFVTVAVALTGCGGESPKLEQRIDADVQATMDLKPQNTRIFNTRVLKSRVILEDCNYRPDDAAASEAQIRSGKWTCLALCDIEYTLKFTREDLLDDAKFVPMASNFIWGKDSDGFIQYNRARLNELRTRELIRYEEIKNRPLVLRMIVMVASPKIRKMYANMPNMHDVDKLEPDYLVNNPFRWAVFPACPYNRFRCGYSVGLVYVVDAEYRPSPYVPVNYEAIQKAVINDDQQLRDYLTNTIVGRKVSPDLRNL